MAHTSNRVPGPSAGFEAGRDVGSNSAVAASYPGRRLSGDKLPTRAEPRQRDLTPGYQGARCVVEGNRTADRHRQPASASSTCSGSSQSSRRTCGGGASLRPSPRPRLPGVYKGRQASIDATKVRAMKAEGVGATEIAEALKIGRASVYGALEDA
jgi:hypothetical protein